MQAEQNSTEGGGTPVEGEPSWKDQRRGGGSGHGGSWQGSQSGSQDGSRRGRGPSFGRRGGRQGQFGRGGRSSDGSGQGPGRGFGRGGRFVERQGEGQQWENLPTSSDNLGGGSDQLGHPVNAPIPWQEHANGKVVSSPTDAGLLGNGPQPVKYMPRQGAGGSLAAPERKGERQRGHEDRNNEHRNNEPRSNEAARGGGHADRGHFGGPGDGQRVPGRGRNWRQGNQSRGVGGGRDRMHSGAGQQTFANGEGGRGDGAFAARNGGVNSAKSGTAPIEVLRDGGAAAEENGKLPRGVERLNGPGQKVNHANTAWAADPCKRGLHAGNFSSSSSPSAERDTNRGTRPEKELGESTRAGGGSGSGSSPRVSDNRSELDSESWNSNSGEGSHNKESVSQSSERPDFNFAAARLDDPRSGKFWRDSEEFLPNTSEQPRSDITSTHPSNPPTELNTGTTDQPPNFIPPYNQTLIPRNHQSPNPSMPPSLAISPPYFLSQPPPNLLPLPPGLPPNFPLSAPWPLPVTPSSSLTPHSNPINWPPPGPIPAVGIPAYAFPPPVQPHSIPVGVPVHLPPQLQQQHHHPLNNNQVHIPPPHFPPPNDQQQQQLSRDPPSLDFNSPSPHLFPGVSRASMVAHSSALKPCDLVPALVTPPASGGRNQAPGERKGLSSGGARGARPSSQKSEPASATAGPFLHYLPQDDAVASGGLTGLRFDASITQAAVDILNNQLRAALKLKPREFWKMAASEDSLPLFLDSYLRFRRRPFDQGEASSQPAGGTVTGVVAGDAELARRVFMVLLRLSSNSERGAVVFPAHEHAGLLKSRRLLTLPMLMDACAIYGRANPELSRQLVQNAALKLPSFRDKVVGIVAPLVRTVASLRVRSADAVKGILARGFTARRLAGDADVATAEEAARKDLLEVADYLYDVASTLAALVDTHPPCAPVLVRAESRDGARVGALLSTLACAHDVMLYGLRRAFLSLAARPHVKNGGAGGAGGAPPSSLEKGEEEERSLKRRLGRLRGRLVESSWLLLQRAYLDGGGAELEGNPSERGDGLVAAVVALGMSAGNSEAADSADSAWADLGSLLRDIQRHHGLLAVIQSERMAGRLEIDEVQFEYLEALLEQPSAAPTRGASSAAPAASLPSASRAPASAEVAAGGDATSAAKAEAEEAAAIQGSKISQIKDLLPDYGDGFLALCLDAYENDAEKVIQNILEGSLHADLAGLDVTMKTKPPPPSAAPPVSTSSARAKDKGKGKVVDEPLSSSRSKGKAAAFGEGPQLDDQGRIRMSTASGASSSSSDVAPPPAVALPRAVATSAETESTSAMRPAGATSSAAATSSGTAGRFVRRQQNGDAVGLLNKRGGAESDAIRRVAMAAATAEDLEYNDEYDDSLDDLGTYGNNAGDDDVETFLDTRLRMASTSVDTSSLLDASTSGRGTSGPRVEPRRGPVAPPLLSSGPHPPRRGDGLLGSGGGPSGGAAGGPSPLEKPARETGEKGKKGPRGEKQGGQFYLKDGKLYGYKVTGGQLVSSQEEATAILKTESETIYGLGRGGNVPIGQSNGGDSEDEGEGSAGVEAESGPRGGEGGGRGGGGRGGRGGRGGGEGEGRGGGGGRGYARKEQNKASVANHRRKDRALKKHTGSVGGL